jgi:AcrR family transcriptional regulator
MARTARKDKDAVPSPSSEGISRWFDLTPMDIEGVAGTEARILDAARRCYVTYGASKMSLNDVADEAGVSRGSVYKYYKNRSELLRRVQVYGISSQMESMDRAMASLDTFEAQIVCAAEQMRIANFTRPPVRERTHSNLVARGLTSEVRRDVDVDQGSEWLARMLLSLVSVPSQSFSFADQAQTARFVRAFAVRGLD